MSRRHLETMIRRLPALLSGLVILFWPAFADANCCCQQAAVEVSLQGNLEDVTPACSHCVVKLREDGTATGIHPCGESDDCDCGIGCSIDFVAVAPSTSLTDRSVSAIGLSVESAFDFPFGTSVVSEAERPSPLRFPFAQDHCAMICCWLK